MDDAILSFVERAEKVALKLAESEQHGCVGVDRYPPENGVPYNEDEVGDILALLQLPAAVLHVVRRSIGAFRSSGDAPLYLATAIVFLLVVAYVSAGFIL